MSTDVLEISKISKSFPGVKALDDVSISVKKGSVHVLCGENGAGKSTLMKIINGLYKPDSGEIRVKGNLTDIKNPHSARANGISMIFQELSYVPEMSIAENFSLGEWPHKLGKIHWKKLQNRVDNLLREEGFLHSAATKIKHLSIAEIQSLEILKAISKNAEIIIMDEPTSAITEREVTNLFNKIGKLKEKGVSIIYISHKMDEIFQIADEITVMRDGQVIETRPKENFTIDAIIKMMVGRNLSNKFPKTKPPETEAINPERELAIEVSNLSRKGVFADINFHAYKGEIIGFAGLMGAGRTEVMRALWGLDNLDFGIVKKDGKEIKIKSIAHSIRHGIAMLTEDRRRYGIIPVRSIRENTTLASLKQYFKKGYLHKEKEVLSTKEICEQVNLNTKEYEKAISKLSGGNQQKVILARWMLLNPDILIMDEPTRGIDVGAKYEIYKLMNQLVGNGKTIIFISSELPELIGMSDRIYVMSGARIQGELMRKDFSQEEVMRLAVSSGVK